MIVAGGSLMAALDRWSCGDGADHDPRRPPRLGRTARVDGERVQAQPRGAADDGRGARRRSGGGAVRRRARALRRRVRGLRARADRRLADRRPRRPGRRRGAPHADRRWRCYAPHSGPAERGRAIGIFSGVTGSRSPADRSSAAPSRQGIAWQWIFWMNCHRPGRDAARADAAWSRATVRARPLDMPAPCSSPALRRARLGALRGNRPAGAAPRWSRRWRRRAANWWRSSAWERRAPRSRCCRWIVRSRPFASGNAAAFFLFAALFGAVFFMAQFSRSPSIAARSTRACAAPVDGDRSSSRRSRARGSACRRAPVRGRRRAAPGRGHGAGSR